MAESKLAAAPSRLACFGVGSCVCVALYDPELKLAGMAHSMLPMAPSSGSLSGEENAKYADTAVSYLLESMESMGAKRERIYARLVGGATMFRFSGRGDSGESLGERNLKAARESLRSLGVPLRGEEGGGSAGRSIEFDPKDGTILVRSAWADMRWL